MVIQNKFLGSDGGGREIVISKVPQISSDYAEYLSQIASRRIENNLRDYVDKC